MPKYRGVIAPISVTPHYKDFGLLGTWPQEYVLSEKDGQQELLETICGRFRAGEGVACRFFRMNNTYLFIGEHKYWLMTHWEDLKPGATT